MKNLNLTIPNNIEYLSQWPEFESMLPPGKLILNKVVCGCGITDYFLTNNSPVILVSPRKELIISKLMSDRTSHAYYFDRSDPAVDVNESKNRLYDYLNNCSYGLVPKIIVTFDSSHIVFNALADMGRLSMFTVIVDEFSCIFTDARLKGSVEMDFLRTISLLQNRTILVSATPIKEIYLNELAELSNMTYVTFDWDPTRLETVTIHRQKMTNTPSAIKSIILDYYSKGYFQNKVIGGVEVFSNEAVFYVNSVKDIVSIIKSLNKLNSVKLDSKNTKVICADSPENQKLLKTINLEIGHFADKNTYLTANVTFTFVTKASFEGADHHSDNASVYIFADSNRKCLSLDISIDIPQIIGRCRTKTNPFRLDAWYYYKTTSAEQFNYEDEKLKIQERLNRSNEFINEFGMLGSGTLLDKLHDAQEHRKYMDDYVDVTTSIDGRRAVILNKLVYLSDIRALEIRQMQYNNSYSVLAHLNSNGYNAIDYKPVLTAEFQDFYNSFCRASGFEEKMKVCYGAFSQGGELEDNISSSPLIPSQYKRYLGLSPDVCEECGYREVALERELAFANNGTQMMQALGERIEPKKPYDLPTVKGILQQIYDSLGLSLKAKATDVKKILPEGYYQSSYKTVGTDRKKVIIFLNPTL